MLDGMPQVCLVFKDVAHGAVVPFLIGPFIRVRLPPYIEIVCPRGQDALFVELPRYLRTSNAAGAHGEYQPHHLRHRFVNEEFMFVGRVLHIAVGRERAHVSAGAHGGFPHSLLIVWS